MYHREWKRPLVLIAAAPCSLFLCLSVSRPLSVCPEEPSGCLPHPHMHGDDGKVETHQGYLVYDGIYRKTEKKIKNTLHCIQEHHQVEYPRVFRMYATSECSRHTDNRERDNRERERDTPVTGTATATATAMMMVRAGMGLRLTRIIAMVIMAAGVILANAAYGHADVDQMSIGNKLHVSICNS